jgi:hypothetical protein
MKQAFIVSSISNRNLSFVTKYVWTGDINF